MDSDDGRKELTEKYNKYFLDSLDGIYNNPYDYDKDMTETLNLSCVEYGSNEYIEWEDRIHELGMAFWQM